MSRLLASGMYADIVAGPSSGQVTKVVRAPRDGRSDFCRPHNIALEVALLKSCSHPNIVEVVDYSYDDMAQTHRLVLPMLACTLSDLISNGIDDDDLQPWFQAIAFQALDGLQHMHQIGIAHRDVCPKNIMLDWDGTLRLIDFSVSYGPTIYDGGEPQDAMYTQVGTMHWRAPELLFGPKPYNPFAIDIWALGAVLADFLLAPQSERTRDHDEMMDEDEERRMLDQEYTGPRRTLFGDERHTVSRFFSFDEISTAARIFRVRGHPRISWPEYDEMPDAGKIYFDDEPPRPLADFFPRLSCLSDPTRVVEILDTMLEVSPKKRISAEAALGLPLLKGRSSSSGPKSLQSARKSLVERIKELESRIEPVEPSWQ